jgi:lipoprotein-anchoring transpeptidase ErfK/SrfK
MVRSVLRMIVGVFAAAGATGAALARDVVAFSAGAAPGTIIVKTSERRLYFVIGDGIALRYPIAVGRAARQWFGQVSITGKYRQPAWSPPADLRRENPDVPDVIPGGAPNNPMGVAALTLSGGDYASTVRTGPARSARSPRMAASACTTRTSPISSRA